MKNTLSIVNCSKEYEHRNVEQILNFLKKERTAYRREPLKSSHLNGHTCSILSTDTKVESFHDSNVVLTRIGVDLRQHFPVKGITLFEPLTRFWSVSISYNNLSTVFIFLLLQETRNKVASSYDICLALSVT